MSFTGLASAETLVRGWLATQFPAPIRVVTELPADMSTAQVIRVTRFGGSDEFITLDTANIDIDVYAPVITTVVNGPSALDVSRTLAEQVRTALRLHLPGYAANGAAVQSVSTISAPRWLDFENTNLRRYNAAYRITIHSIPS